MMAIAACAIVARGSRWNAWIERQVIVMRCAHCGALAPVDRSKCKNCGASIDA